MNKTRVKQKFHNLLKHSSLILLKLDHFSCKYFNFKILPDKWAIKLKYKIGMNKRLNIRNPKTFNEKIQWIKLYDRNPEYTRMADKYEARKYISEKIGEEYLIPLLGVWNRFDDINFNELPNQFVLKCTHDCASVVICKDKSQFDLKAAKDKLNTALLHNYYFLGREWVYKNIKPRIIAEIYLEDESADLTDYKFMCFNGEVKCSFVCTKRNSKEGLCVTFFDKDWNRFAFTRAYPNDNEIIEKPANYAMMIELAELIAENKPFLRVDFYEVKGKLYIGELVHYPGNGLEKFNPPEWDNIFGSWLSLPGLLD
ncbi:MAG: glycosyl transferase [Lachnospiraceae bacterium]|nr:glycosyl transferase [Lachnospiraceae bacterium]